ncbi:MAG: amidohydrolase family protein, partial [Acidobacteriaceae bacterium]|nr:amidohydrolase family protein [Acidobacteriaceae bacterium]
MPEWDVVICGTRVVDGSGREPFISDVALAGDRIGAVGANLDCAGAQVVAGRGLVLAPGFIDVHTHDDTNVIRTPEMLPKLTQGVTTVIVGNCGISAAPVRLRSEPPDPMNLLGIAEVFRYPTFAEYVESVEAARPSVNVAALVGHTALRNNHMDQLDRAATAREIEAMRHQLIEALDGGALGLSTGLAYLSSKAATTEEVLALAEPLARAG